MKLIEADNPTKLNEFAQAWIPFTKTWLFDNPMDYEDEMNAVYDTRELISLVLSIKSLIDNGTCNCDALREIGFRIEQKSETQYKYGVVYLPKCANLSDWVERQTDYIDPRKVINYIGFEGSYIADYSGSEIKEQKLHLPNQRKHAESLDDSKNYKVFEFFISADAADVDDYRYASIIMDHIMKMFLNNCPCDVSNGIVSFSTECNMRSFWLLVSEQFSSSRVILCKTCGRPVFVSAERGEKRQYCSNSSCKRKYMRAMKFYKLVNEEHMSKEEAAKQSQISPHTAEQILSRSRLHLRTSDSQ